jgi:hypothetical protein
MHLIGIRAFSRGDSKVSRNNQARVAIAVAGVATSVMGAFHFFLPRLFGWARFSSTLPNEIQWALFSLNSFFSLLLLAGGLATLRAIRKNDPTRDWSIWIMGIFWLFNSGYQFLWPFPTPQVRWILFGFAFVVAALYILGALALRGIGGVVSRTTGESAAS